MEDFKKEKYVEKYPRPITMEGTRKILNQMETNICKIIAKGETGTGFFCIINYDNHFIPVMITNNHVINEKYLKKNKTLKITINDDKYIKTIQLDDSRIIYTKSKEEYDITIIEIKPEKDKIYNFMEIDEKIFLEESNALYNENHSIYIIQYPKGNEASVSYGIIKSIDGYNISHKCSTESGSSGSPIINLLNHKIIGIHKESSSHFNMNRGTYLKNPINEFIKNYKNNIRKKNYNIENINDNYLISSKIKNEIELELKVDENDLNNKICFLGKNGLNNLDELSIDLYINNNKSQYKKYFIPKKGGIYKIKIQFKRFLNSCHLMFGECKNIININFQNFNTKDVTNMSFMFYECSNLASLDLSSFDTGSVTNMNNMFDECSNLANLDLSSFDTHSVTNMSNMFNKCSNLANLDLSSFDTKHVTNMSFMFYECSNLANLNLSSFDTGSVTNMSSMFYKCSNLANLDLSSFDTHSVTNMSNMFDECSRIAKLNLSSFDTKNVTNMKAMFNNCSFLTKLNISSFGTSNVTNMSSMFRYCTNLQNIDLSSFNTKKVTSMERMFSMSGRLKNINLSSFDTSSVTDMSFMFYKCYGLKNMNLSSFDTKNVKYIKGIFHGCISNFKLSSSFDKFSIETMTASDCIIF